MDKDRLIKISDMASMHGISRQTLILYDKNGLLKPAFVSESGYRYYTTEQIPRLRAICLLKECGIPLARISEFMDAPTPEGMRTLLNRRLEALDQQLDYLVRQREYVCHYERLYHDIDARKMNVGVPFVVRRAERKALFAPYPDDGMDISRLHLVLMKAWGKLLTCGMIPSDGFGSLLLPESLATRTPLAGAGCVILLPFPEEVEGVEEKNLVTFSEGNYLTVYKYAMPYNPEPARELLEWMDLNGIKAKGPVFDQCLLDATYYDDEHQSDFCRLEVRIGD